MSLCSKRRFAAALVVSAVLCHPPAMLGQALTFTTFAGPQAGAGFEDGTGSAARFFSPQGVATDSSGNVYVADQGNQTIRKITPAGAVTTLAGLAGTGGSADGTGSAARFNDPLGVATDSSGNVYVADAGNNRIRIGRATLADAATIDLSTGARGATRQLDTSPQTATSFQWSVIRRPVDAAANLSSATVRNPTFTPDVLGLFTFRLIATGAAATSITTVNLTAGVPGDANNDGAISVGDVFYLINFLFAGGPAPV